MTGLRLVLCLIGSLIVATPMMVGTIQGQTVDQTRQSVVTDWSHRHVVFSAPATDYQSWRLQQEPRYQQQTIQRMAAARVQPDIPMDTSQFGNKKKKNKMKRDWAMSLGAGGTTGAEMFPAKYGFDINAAPSCANDFVVFTTSLTGGGAAVAASQTGTFNNTGTPAGTVTIGGTLTLTASTTLNTGTNFQVSNATPTTDATNLAAAINRVGNGDSVGVLATSAGGVVTVTATTTGTAGNSITLTEGPLTRFAWAGGTLTGGADATGSIVAYNQLYSTQGSVGGLCNQNGPSIMWFYNTNTTGQAVTSPVLSLDGTKVAYVESRAVGSVLHILKWKSGQGSSSGAVAPDQSISSWGSCTAGNSCIVDLAFNGAQPDTNSSPFYNYANDTLYVGDDNSRLHKFTPVFSGTPAEVTTGWPIQINGTTNLSSPVFDSGSGNIFVGDDSGRLSYVRELGSSAGACAAGTPPCLGSTTVALGGVILDAPLVDSTTGKVHWFSGQTTTTTGKVMQTDTALGTQRTITFTNNGGTPMVSQFHVGAFDNAYLTSSSPSITGFLYVIARTSANRDHPALFRIGFNGSGLMNTVTANGPLDLVSASGEDASPITAILNGATERIFVSVNNNGNRTGCTGACLYSFDITSGFPANSTSGFQVTGGTSGIVVDNVSASSQASNIYFTFRSNSTAGRTCNGVSGVGCALKLTQSALN